MTRPSATVSFRRDVERWSERLRVRPKVVQIRRMTQKWASCSAAGRVSFSRDLLRRERRFREVVIVHELLHLRVRNHGKLFRGLMHAHVPGWERLLDGSPLSCR